MSKFDGFGDDIFDIRDVIARFEELEEQIQDEEIPAAGEDRDEFAMLQAFLEDVKGYGGDEQWRGDWYPVTFILDSYFKTYAQELAEDIGAINKDASWPNTCIDWDQATRELQIDYSTVDVAGFTYWYR